MPILRATESFRTAGRKKGDRGRLVKEGELFRDNDPLLKGIEHLFESVEAATAAPGEKRAISRPRKPAKKKG